MAIKRTDMKFWFIIGVAAVVLVALIWLLTYFFEGEKPTVDLKWASPALGRQQTLRIALRDQKSGLRRVWVGLIKDGKEHVLLEKSFPSRGLLSRGNVHAETIEVAVEPHKLGVSDGKGRLRIAVWDYAWRRIFHGNRTYLDKEVLVDTVPPAVEVLSRSHNIRPGGAEMVIYKLSEDCPVSGVQVGDNFFPGHSGQFKDKYIHLALFALRHDQGADTQIFLKATDYAGNSVRAGFPFYIGKRRFRNDRINISDAFLNWKMPEFQKDLPGMAGKSPEEQFLVVNRDVRKQNYSTITALGSKSEERLYWRGAFLRMPGTARKAGFADHRTYYYKGREIDKQYHLGIDLASVAHAPVPAANNGKVLFCGVLGIYGNVVVIDHGFGLLSMYAHLSQIDVTAGKMVKKGDYIGRTGVTGLAGGDHLHFGVIVYNTFVNPVEWWDPKWVKQDITMKIEAVKRRQ